MVIIYTIRNKQHIVTCHFVCRAILLDCLFFPSCSVAVVHLIGFCVNAALVYKMWVTAHLSDDTLLFLCDEGQEQV